MKASTLLMIASVALLPPGVSGAPRVEENNDIAKFATYAPMPFVPQQAHDMQWRGKGTYRLYIRRETGDVSEIKILKRTGHFVVDSAALRTLVHWHFRRGAPDYVDVTLLCDPHG